MLKIFNDYYPILFNAFLVTLRATMLSIIFASVIGLIFGMLNASKNKIAKTIATVYIDVIRGIPLLVLTYFIYLGMPSLLKNMDLIPQTYKLPAITAGIIALSLNAGAYMAEIVRGGIQSVDKGQMEAARSLGMTRGKSMLKVVLPQAIRVMIPSIINQFIITLKDTSIVSVIGLNELTKIGDIIVAKNFKFTEVWASVAVIYLIVITILSKIAKVLERRISYDK